MDRRDTADKGIGLRGVDDAPREERHERRDEAQRGEGEHEGVELSLASARDRLLERASVLKGRVSVLRLLPLLASLAALPLCWALARRLFPPRPEKKRPEAPLSPPEKQP